LIEGDIDVLKQQIKVSTAQLPSVQITILYKWFIHFIVFEIAKLEDNYMANFKATYQSQDPLF
jgi:hypothetical protein